MGRGVAQWGMGEYGSGVSPTVWGWGLRGGWCECGFGSNGVVRLRHPIVSKKPFGAPGGIVSVNRTLARSV
eukprot:7287749-Pyramimonas_sp.AAC.1